MRWVALAGLVVALALGGLALAVVRSSGGVWWVREAPVPEGWPTLTPVGQVVVKQYPAVRAAVVRDPEPGRGGDAMDSMFGRLFEHIQSRDIAMTTPVAMGYAGGGDADAAGDAPGRMASMAVCSRRPTQCGAQRDGSVVVEDFPPRSYASIGVRGDYTPARFAEALEAVDAWLADHAEMWAPAGPPRYLGYNSPFVPSFMRYGEVQRPVERVEGP